MKLPRVHPAARPLACLAALLLLHPSPAQEPGAARKPVAITPKFPGENRPVGFPDEPPAATLTTGGGPTVALCLAYSPDGRTLAVGDGPNRPICTFLGRPPVNGNGGLIRLVDAATNRVRLTLGPQKIDGHEYEVRRVAFSPDGRVIVSEGRDRDGAAPPGSRTLDVPDFTARDAATGRVLHRSVGAPDDPWTLTAIAPGAGTLAASTELGLALRDGRTGRLRRLVRDPASRPRVLEFSPDGRTLAVGDEDGSATLLDAGSGREVARFPGRERLGHRFAVGVLAFSPDGRSLATAGAFRLDRGGLWTSISELRLFDVAGRAERAVVPLPDGETVTCLAFSPDGRTIATGGDPNVGDSRADTGRLTLRDAASLAPRGAFTTRQQWLMALAYSPDGRTLAAADRGTIVLRDAADGRFRVLLPGETSYPGAKALAFSPDGRRLAAVDGAFQLWDLGDSASPRSR